MKNENPKTLRHEGRQTPARSGRAPPIRTLRTRKNEKKSKFALLLKPRKVGRLREKVTRRRAGCQCLVGKLHPISHSMVLISDSTDRELKIEEFRAKGDCNTENTKKDSESSTERE